MREVNRSTVYRHYKGGYYYVLDIAEHTETGEIMVVYHELYSGEGLAYVRPVEMFLSEVSENTENPTGQLYRFEEVYFSE